MLPPYVPQNYHHHPHHSYDPPYLSSRILSGLSQILDHILHHVTPQHLTNLSMWTGLNTHTTLLTVPSHLLIQITYLQVATPTPQLQNGVTGWAGTVWDKHWGKYWWEGRGGSNRGTIGGAKKWIVVEDQRLTQAWINLGADPIVGADRKCLASGIGWSRLLMSSVHKRYRHVLQRYVIVDGFAAPQ